MSLSDDFNLSALKDTYDYSCFRARSDEYRRLMTDSPAARLLAPNKCGERLWPRLLRWEHLRLRAGAKKRREEDVVDLWARLP